MLLFVRLLSVVYNVRLFVCFCLLFLYFVVCVQCRRKKFTFAISSADEFLVGGGICSPFSMYRHCLKGYNNNSSSNQDDMLLLILIEIVVVDYQR